MNTATSRRTLRALGIALAHAGAGAALILSAACSSNDGSVLPPTPAVLSRSYLLYRYDAAALPQAATWQGGAGQLIADTVRVWTNGSITGVSYFQGATGAPAPLRLCEAEGTTIAPPFGNVDFGTALGRGVAGEDTVRLTTGVDYWFGRGHALTYVRITEGTDPAFVCQ